MIKTITADEYIAPDSTLAAMLTYWHGWWRFMWRWHSKNVGVSLPSIKNSWAHRKYCDSKYRDKIGFSFTLWRLSFVFNCTTIKESRARHREMFKDDIWPMVVLDDPLDAEIIG